MNLSRYREQVAEWDEYLQGYNEDGQLVVCICGEVRPNGNWEDHFCPYGQPEGGVWEIA